MQMIIRKTQTRQTIEHKIGRRLIHRLAIALSGLLLSHNVCAQTPKNLNTSAHYPLIDAHSHYSLEDSQHFSPAQINQILKQNQIRKILITSTPNQGTQALMAHAPDRVIPFLSVYQSKADKPIWMRLPYIIPQVEKALKNFAYQGIGEIHIFKKDRKSPVFKQLVKIAQRENLPMLIHADAEVIDEAFAINPQAKILWAHLGTKPEVSRLKAMLQKYPHQLFIDTSVRDKQLLASGGDNQLSPQWVDLFTQHQNQFLVAVDTFSVNRWNHYHLVVSDIQHWLQALPKEVAEKLAYKNAERFFGLEER